MMPESQCTPVSEWRATVIEGFPIQLPSGKIARLRRTLDLLELIKAGKIPNPLADSINQMITSAGKFEIDKLPQEAVPQLLEMVDSMVPRIFVFPKVYLPPTGSGFDWLPEDPEGISLLHVDLRDRMFAFGFAQGGPATLEPFRPEPAEAVADSTDGEPVPLPTESDAGVG